MKIPPSIIVLFLLGSIEAAAQNPTVVFSFTVDDYPESRIIESLMDGHRSEVRFEFRMLRKAKGFRKIFGDKLLAEEERVFVARWDAFDESFIVTVDETTEHIFSDAISFLNFFLSVNSHRMAVSESLLDDDYLMCRWRIQPIKLVPPLTLMTLVKSDLQTNSSWKQTVFEQVNR